MSYKLCTGFLWTSYKLIMISWISYEHLICEIQFPFKLPMNLLLASFDFINDFYYHIILWTSENILTSIKWSYWKTSNEPFNNILQALTTYYKILTVLQTSYKLLLNYLWPSYNLKYFRSNSFVKVFCLKKRFSDSKIKFWLQFVNSSIS